MMQVRIPIDNCNNMNRIKCEEQILNQREINYNKDITLAFQLGMAYGIGIVNDDKDQIIEKLKNLVNESILDKIDSYINHIKNSGMGKKKSFDYIKKFINGLRVKECMEK